MKALVLIICFTIAATVAKPQKGSSGDDCSDCENRCKTVKKVKFVIEYDKKCHNVYK